MSMKNGKKELMDQNTMTVVAFKMDTIPGLRRLGRVLSRDKSGWAATILNVPKGDDESSWNPSSSGWVGESATWEQNVSFELQTLELQGYGKWVDEEKLQTLERSSLLRCVLYRWLDHLVRY